MPKRTKTNLFYKLYLDVASSIALIPAFILFLLLCLALLTLVIDQTYPDLLLSESAPINNFISTDSARSLLSAIASGMITLTVFSFTMVMVVLNQTASNYSPRALSTLLRSRFHQIIMGAYLGTIVFTFIVLSAVQSAAYSFQAPIFSLITNASLCLICLILFIIFIQEISVEVQPGNIVNKIYEDTLKGIETELNKERLDPHQVPAVQTWSELESPVSGYLDEVVHSLINKTCTKLDITIKMKVAVGRFVNKRDPFFYVTRALSDSEREELFLAFVFRHQEAVAQNYIYGFKQLTEIAVKALSPGINDPGTAIQAIDRLTDLFVNVLELEGFPALKDKENKLRFIYQPFLFEDIFYFCFSAIKNYTGSHVPVMLKLLLLIKSIHRNDKEGKLAPILLTAVKDAVEQFTPDFRSGSDKKRFIYAVLDLKSLYKGHSDWEHLTNMLAPLRGDDVDFEAT